MTFIDKSDIKTLETCSLFIKTVTPPDGPRDPFSFRCRPPVEPEQRRQGRPNRDSALCSELHKVGMEELSLLDL